MASKLKASINSMRLRTLPLSLSGIIMGIMMAAVDSKINALTIIFLVLTTICLQVLANLSNELGDFQRGTDTDDRQGIMYSMQSGGLSVKDMKKLIVLFIALCCIFGVLMIHFSFGSIIQPIALAFMMLGAAAIIAAMKYTLGKKPYGYNAKGDYSVFIFFGLTTVLGGYFICSHSFSSAAVILPAITIGLFSVGVLNVNNIRDMKTDAATRVTIAIKLGEHKARIYQSILIILGWICFTVYAVLQTFSIFNFLYVLTLPLYILHLRGVWTKKDKELDSMVPLLSISTFLFALIGGLGLLL